MARPRRIEVPDGYFHVTTRGNNGICIYPTVADRRSWIGTLEHAAELAGWQCLAWAQLGNHYHLLCRTPRPTLAYGMHVLNTLHAKNVNRRHGRRNHLFGRRYTSTLVETEAHLHQALRYIAWNAVRAGLCAAPAQWRWSSYGSASGCAATAPGVDPDALAAALETTPARLARTYRAVVEDL